MEPSTTTIVDAANPTGSAADPLAGYTLTPFGPEAFAEAEQEFNRRFMHIAAAAAIGLPEQLASRLIETTVDKVSVGTFAFGTVAFRLQAISPTSIPFLLWLALKPKHPEITLDQATTIITPQNMLAIHRAVVTAVGIPLPSQAA